MIETANSSVVKSINAEIVNKNINGSKPVSGELIKIIKRWPATIFAVNRTDNVRGRITPLTNSIKTMKGINACGVPRGTR